MKKCRFCAEDIQDEAIKCKHCGEMVGSAASPSTSSAERGSPVFRVVGILLLLGGLAYASYFYVLFDTTVSAPTLQFMGQSFGGGRVHNIGLMQERQTGLMVGGGVAFLGFALLLVGELAHLGRQRKEPRKPDDLTFG